LDEIQLPDAPACALLPDPGDDPPLGDAIDPSDTGAYTDNYKNANGYSNEELRATVMTDLIHMAFACDISRVTSFMLTYAQCFMNMFTLRNTAGAPHEVTHGSVGGGEEQQFALATCAAWHVKHFARLVQKLRDTEDVDGSKILDHTALVLAFEGGWGYDLEADNPESPHSTENMVMLVGGKAGGLHATPATQMDPRKSPPAAVPTPLIKATGATKPPGEVPDPSTS